MLSLWSTVRRECQIAEIGHAYSATGRIEKMSGKKTVNHSLTFLVVSFARESAGDQVFDWIELWNAI